MWLFRGGEIFSYGKFLWIQVVLNVSIDCFYLWRVQEDPVLFGARSPAKPNKVHNAEKTQTGENPQRWTIAPNRIEPMAIPRSNPVK